MGRRRTFEGRRAYARAVALSCWTGALAAPAWGQVPLWSTGSLSGGSGGGVGAEGAAVVVAAAGDVDGNGVGDVVIGMPGFAGGDGRVSVRSGLDGSPIHAATEVGPPGAGWETGFAVSGVGDLDGDGLDELVVGVPGDGTMGEDAGSVRVFSGAGAVELFVAHGAHAGARMGHAVSGVGDVDGDGVPDFLAGVPGSMTDVGAAVLFSGASYTPIRTLVHPDASVAAGSRFGAAVAGPGDISGDGVPDLLIGAPEAQEGGMAASGSAVGFSGADGSPLFTQRGTAAGERLGTSLAGAGDVDGNGRGDLVVGAPGATDPAGTGPGHGALRVFGGAPGYAALRTHYGDEPGDGLGGAAHGLFVPWVTGVFQGISPGDADLDGVPEYAAGCGGPQGYARVYSGKTGLDLFKVVDVPAPSFGTVAAVGDLDLDLVPDFVAGGADGVRAMSGSPPLRVLQPQVSVATGGTVDLLLVVGLAHASDAFWMLGSRAGTTPGIDLEQSNVPLNPDEYLDLLKRNPFAPPLTNFLGFFSSGGFASASLTIPPALDPALVGTELHHAFVGAVELGVPAYTSNAVAIEFVP